MAGKCDMTVIPITSLAAAALIDREAVVHAARHLALQRDDVVRLTEVLNDRPWAECGPEEIAVVVQVLRELVRRRIAGETHR
jgi:hypothetical protein